MSEMVDLGPEANAVFEEELAGLKGAGPETTKLALLALILVELRRMRQGL